MRGPLSPVLPLAAACALLLSACTEEAITPASCPVGAQTGPDGLCKATCNDSKPCLLSETCTDGVCAPRDPTLPTVIMLRATPAAVPEGGESEVEFVVSGAEKVELIRFEAGGQDQSVYLDDQRPQAGRVRLARLVQDTYVRLEASSGDRTDTEEITIAVAKESGDVSIQRFNASASEVRAGEEVTLTWATTNASTVVIKQDDEPKATDLPGSGALTVKVDYTTIFTLIAEGSPQAATAQVHVEVAATPGPQVLEVGFNPATGRILEGDNAILKWRTANATQVQLQAGGTIFHTEQDAQTVAEGLFLVSPGPGTVAWTVLASRPPDMPVGGAATLSVAARPPVPTFSRPPSVTPQVMPMSMNEDHVELVVQWRVLPADAEVTVTVGGIAVNATGATEHRARVPTGEPARIEVRAVVAGGGMATAELIAMPQSPEEEPNDTQLNPNGLQDRLRMGTLSRGQLAWDVDWYTTSVVQDGRLLATVQSLDATGQCQPGLTLSVRRQGLAMPVATEVTTSAGVCPVIILEHLDAASYRLEVSMSGQATGATSVPYLVAAQTFGPTCGDGVVDTGEACDDGGRAVGDACSPTCTIPATHQYTAQERNAAFTEPPDSAADVHFLPYTASPASDDGYAFLELPVPFPFFGRTFHGLLLTTNGYLSFLPYADTSPNLNAPLGEVAPNALVTAVGTDLKLVATSRVRWWVEDDAQGKKRFIIDLKDLALKQDARPMVQARIELAADGEVVIAYGDLGLPNGTTFAAGLEGPEGIIRIPLPRCDALCDGGDVRGRRFILRPNAVSTGGM